MGFFDKNYVQVDKQLMEDGAEIDFGDDFFITIRHVSAKKVEMARSKIVQELKVMSRNKDFTPEQNRAIRNYTVAHGGIVGWRGGDAPTFTPEVAIEIFEQRPEFIEDIMSVMTSYEGFRKEQIDDASGNSSKSSNGESNSASTSKPSKLTKPEGSE